MRCFRSPCRIMIGRSGHKFRCHSIYTAANWLRFPFQRTYILTWSYELVIFTRCASALRNLSIVTREVSVWCSSQLLLIIMFIFCRIEHILKVASGNDSPNAVDALGLPLGIYEDLHHPILHIYAIDMRESHLISPNGPVYGTDIKSKSYRQAAIRNAGASNKLENAGGLLPNRSHQYHY